MRRETRRPVFVKLSPTLTNILLLQVKDAAAGVASMRTLGTGSMQAAQGSAVAYLGLSQTFTGPQTKLTKVGFVASGSGLTIVAGAGLMPTPTLLTVSGTDNYGLISITPSANSGTSAVICTVTFGVAFGSTPLIVLIPKSSAAITGQAAARLLVVSSDAAGSFNLTSGTLGLASGVPYTYAFLAIPTS